MKILDVINQNDIQGIIQKYQDYNKTIEILLTLNVQLKNSFIALTCKNSSKLLTYSKLWHKLSKEIAASPCEKE